MESIYLYTKRTCEASSLVVESTRNQVGRDVICLILKRIATHQKLRQELDFLLTDS